MEGEEEARDVEGGTRGDVEIGISTDDPVLIVLKSHGEFLEENWTT